MFLSTFQITDAIKEINEQYTILARVGIIEIGVQPYLQKDLFLPQSSICPDFIFFYTNIYHTLVPIYIYTILLYTHLANIYVFNSYKAGIVPLCTYILYI